MITCTICGRTIDSDHCGFCKPNRIHAVLCYRVCQSNKCECWGTDEFDRTGCLLNPKPCLIFDHLLAGKGCLAEPPLFAATPDVPKQQT